jgi:NitT/TauT family transport system substrate-binding protein
MLNFKFSRRQWFVTSLISLVLLAILSTASLLSHEAPISIAAHTWPGYEPMFMARNEGWLDDARVHLHETKSATESMHTLTQGQVDGAALTLDEVLRVRASGIPLTVVMIFNVSAGADVLLVKPSIKKMSELKAKRIGVEGSAVGDIMLAEILREAGFTKKDVTIVAMPISQHLAAWKDHQLDAVITYDPVATQIISTTGAARLFDSRHIPKTIIDVLAIRTDKINRRSGMTIHHLIETHFKALTHFQQNPQDASYRMAKRLDLPADKVLNAYKGLLFVNEQNNYRLMTGKKPELFTIAQRLVKIMREAHLIEKNDDLNALINADYLPVDSFY